jgi:hypothetical protein
LRVVELGLVSGEVLSDLAPSRAGCDGLCGERRRKRGLIRLLDQRRESTSQLRPEIRQQLDLEQRFIGFLIDNSELGDELATAPRACPAQDRIIRTQH